MSAKNAGHIMDINKGVYRQGGVAMDIISFVFFGFLGVLAAVICFRSGKTLVKAINRLFDKIDKKLC